MNCSSGLTSDVSVKNSLVSWAYFCSFVDTEPRERLLVGDEALIFCHNAAVAMENSHILRGQPCCMPVVIGMWLVREWLTNILTDIRCKRIEVYWIKAGGRLIWRMSDKMNLWKTLSNALAKSSWSMARGWLMSLTSSMADLMFNKTLWSYLLLIAACVWNMQFSKKDNKRKVIILVGFLYSLLRSEIGRQFRVYVHFPDFGISLTMVVSWKEGTCCCMNMLLHNWCTEGISWVLKVWQDLVVRPSEPGRSIEI